MKFVATKTADQLDLQPLHRVRARPVSQRTGIINQIRAFLLERGIAVRQGLRFLRAQLPEVLESNFPRFPCLWSQSSESRYQVVSCCWET
jgi:transposase